MTFDGHQKPDDSHAGKPHPAGHKQAFNGHDLLSEHSTVVGKHGDHTKVAGNPNFEVGDSTVAAAKPVTVDAPRVKTEVASLVGADMSGPPESVANRLAQQRETQFNNYMAAINGATKPEHLQAVLASIKDSSSAAAKALSRIGEMQSTLTV
jgi:hypothetical protein